MSKVRVFIQPLGQRGGAYDVGLVQGGNRQIERTLRPLAAAFQVTCYTIRNRPRVRGLVAAAGGGR